MYKKEVKTLNFPKKCDHPSFNVNFANLGFEPFTIIVLI